MLEDMHLCIEERVDDKIVELMEAMSCPFVCSLGMLHFDCPKREEGVEMAISLQVYIDILYSNIHTHTPTTYVHIHSKYGHPHAHIYVHVHAHAHAHMCMCV